ncbi:YdeI/OmpD-associated family protein [Nocardia huaxiensis]|uniref:YdeI/OmpD-associated family protein n=1 Tax=Nocardia huaxiensis TaxID=2755382 RepID=A0A7D6Z196_9NOCA|nr:YdeI/OmpD-associated family protein [Nocardia huaxiensis]QLY30046.1 YdeI/OmpD-associated family protein [Nocardia huaxiensis]UFS96357.1 YdeI/OmpD-associated family protein [Nocardia huaxiensis]
MDPVTFSDAAAFDTWLEANHAVPEGVWIRMAKAGSGIPSLTSDEAVDVGLCWGWISGQRKGLDSEYYLQKYVPRRPRSHWSQVNVDKVAELTAAGRMRAPGLAEVAAAKADGRWAAAYPSQSSFTVPPDLAEALDRRPAARAAFEELDRTRRYAIVLELLRARSGKTRATRLAKALANLEPR